MPICNNWHNCKGKIFFNLTSFFIGAWLTPSSQVQGPTSSPGGRTMSSTWSSTPLSSITRTQERWGCTWNDSVTGAAVFNTHFVPQLYITCHLSAVPANDPDAPNKACTFVNGRQVRHWLNTKQEAYACVLRTEDSLSGGGQPMATTTAVATVRVQMKQATAAIRPATRASLGLAVLGSWQNLRPCGGAGQRASQVGFFYSDASILVCMYLWTFFF